MITSLPTIRVYSKPQDKSEQIDELLFGDGVEVVEKSNGFLKIITDYNYKGWIKDCHFAPENPVNYMVFQSCADILPCPNYSLPAATALPFGAKIAVCGENGRFFGVKMGDNRYYIHKNHVLPISKFQGIPEWEFRKSVIKIAKKYLGVQYRWGGRSHKGIDCSGLCFNAYRFSGVNIWRDAKIEKSPNLRSINLSSAQMGDLLFFRGHVALYLGEGEIIHSSASAGEVLTEKLGENRYLKEIFICAGTLF